MKLPKFSKNYTFFIVLLVIAFILYLIVSSLKINAKEGLETKSTTTPAVTNIVVRDINGNPVSLQTTNTATKKPEVKPNTKKPTQTKPNTKKPTHKKHEEDMYEGKFYVNKVHHHNNHNKKHQKK